MSERNEQLLRAVVAEVKDDVAAYFRSIGFEVTWDFYKHTGLRWYEIYDGDVQLIQIDFGAPLADLKTDLPMLARGEKSTCSSNWEVRGPIENVRRVVARMKERS